ncbi:hypothetical protein CRE_16288 [Caenorhabditis remanei]|uniref:Diacylglycerol kinase n=1 Tax=Caenorhabditis remanei TaxID=31234 RepID=E3N2K5_CAERE|nr:hypothetical protein CRE_16288 [Caenorhabditis remanei]
MVATRLNDDEQEVWKQSILRAKDNLPEKASGPLVALLEGTSGHHHWTETNHPRPTFCNYCREKLNGVPWHGYTCDICKVKAHRKCRDNITEPCKWTNQSSIPQHLQFISPENSILPHQWMEGNLPMPAKCSVCEKPCGSVRKLVDYRCIWCGCCVHDACIGNLARSCSLGHSALSVISPLALKGVNSNGTAILREEAYGGEFPGGSPLIVLINAKSGDSQGQRIIKKFRRILNPIQVFDIIATGPDFALTFFSQLESFRVLVCGGDGTVGWVLSAFDRLNLHSKCQLAILPLGTGNDLARVLGWGHAFYDDTLLPQVVRTMERAHTKMLDRWSVLAIEGPQADAVRRYEELVIEKVRTFLDAEQSSDIIHAANQLCTTIRELVHNVSQNYSTCIPTTSGVSTTTPMTSQNSEDKEKSEQEEAEGRQSSDTMTENCNTLLGKLDRLMKSLKEDANYLEESGFEPGDDDECSTGDEMLKRRDSVVNRANSLKKALREVISMAEKGIDQHYRDTNTAACTRRERFRKKRSKTTPSVLRISHSNLSSSSACSPPCSPAEEEETEGKEFRSASCKATFDISHSQSSSSAVLTALFNSQSNSQSARNFDELEKLEKPSIGTVHPPTPGATREPSTAYDDDVENSGEPKENQTSESSRRASEDVPTNENMKGSPDRPRIYSDTTLNKNSDKIKSQSLHPICSSGVDKMKQSHSDSSLYGEYEHMEGSSSGCGVGASGSTLSPSRPSDSATWSRIKERKRTVGSDLGLSSSSHLRSCRNMLSGFAGGSLIAEILLLNARVLSQMSRAVGSIPNTGGNVNQINTSVDCQTPFTQYKEMCVMNNYFGIGLDAKIALEFHNKREESEKTRSRSKLFMWYGILGGKELMHRTYRNLEQRIKLECDGVPIDLPSLQGIVILNIPSYSGGANFWGRNKDGPEFTVQSFDDRILEVVALFGVIHVATSRVPNAVRLQNHRIAQCRHVRIVILGDEPIPVQVDGEPWLQPPGIMQIVHKNRAQMLARNAVFDATLKKWEEQKEKATTAPSTPTALGASGGTAEHIPFLTRAREFLRLIEGEIARLGVSSVLLGSLDDANAIVRGGASGEEDPE